MNINQKSLAVLASPYLFGVSRVGAAFAALASYPARSHSATLSGIAKPSLLRDGDASYKQERKGGFRCADVIPANRVNRAGRRASAKLKLTKAQ